METNYEHISLRKDTTTFFDFATFFIILLILAIGLMSIYSATYEAGSSISFYKQLIFTGIGFFAMLVFTFFSKKLLDTFATHFYIIGLILLILVLIIGTGPPKIKAWIPISSFHLQPSEVAKFTTLIMLSKFLANPSTDVNNLRDFIISLLIIAIPIGLILLEPDFGTATVIFVMWLGVLYWAGFDDYIILSIICVPLVLLFSLMDTLYFIIFLVAYTIISFILRKRLLMILITISILAIVGYTSHLIYEELPKHQKNRIDVFINPSLEPVGKSYNAIQSTLAVGSGGLFGKGYLKGTQTQLRYVPEQRTDFIFSVPTEEFGFIGSVLIVLLFTGLLIRSLKISAESEDKFLSIISFGITTIFFYHCVVNIGMVIGLMPIMGIPLPFMSYGGSALIVNLSMVGLLLNTYRTQRKSKYLS